jgi:hypothetical protein
MAAKSRRRQKSESESHADLDRDVRFWPKAAVQNREVSAV